MMMFDIDPAVARLFFQDRARFPKDSDVTTAAGIDALLPGSRIQEFCFEPCGYSMNGLLYDAYWTIHITPESHCSYASFETNIRMPNYDSLVRAVLSIFRPQRYTMTLFADESGLRSIKPSPFHSILPVPLVTSSVQAIMGPCVLTHDKYGNSVFESSGNEPLEGEAPQIPGIADTPEGLRSPCSSRSDGESDVTKPIRRVPTVTAIVPAALAGGKGVLTYVGTAKCSTEFLGYVTMLGNFSLVHAAQGSVTSAGATNIADVAGGLLDMPRVKHTLAAKTQEAHLRQRTESI